MLTNNAVAGAVIGVASVSASRAREMGGLGGAVITQVAAVITPNA
jgi:hypothetical protein